MARVECSYGTLLQPEGRSIEVWILYVTTNEKSRNNSGDGAAPEGYSPKQSENGQEKQEKGDKERCGAASAPPQSAWALKSIQPWASQPWPMDRQ